MEHMQAKESPLRKVGNILGGMAAGFGQGMNLPGMHNALHDMATTAKRNSDAKEQRVVSELKAANSLSKMAGMDPKLFAEMRRNLTEGQKGGQNAAKLLEQQQKDKALADARDYRNHVYNFLSGVQAGKAQTYQQQVNQQGVHLGNADTTARMNAGTNAQKAGSYQQQVDQMGGHYIRSDANAQGNMQANQARAGAYQQQVNQGGIHQGNQDMQAAANNNFKQAGAVWQAGLKAHMMAAEMAHRSLMKNPDDPEAQQAFQVTDGAFKDYANQMNAAMQQAEQPMQPQPVAQSAAPMQGRLEQAPQPQAQSAPQRPQPAPQRPAMPPPQVMQNIANVARQIAASHPGMTPQQAVMLARQQMRM